MLQRLEFSLAVEEGWALLKPELDLSTLGLIQRLLWVSRLLDELLERSAVAGGLRNRSDYEVLVVLRRNEPKRLTPVQISSQLQVSPSGMTSKLDRLENLGLVRRLPDPADRRVVGIELTDTGRSAADQAFMINLSLYDSLLEPLTDAERDALDKLLRVILQRSGDLASSSQPWSTP